jgi:hypothetical protein
LEPVPHITFSSEGKLKTLRMYSEQQIITEEEYLGEEEASSACGTIPSEGII